MCVAGGGGGDVLRGGSGDTVELGLCLKEADTNSGSLPHVPPPRPAAPPAGAARASPRPPWCANSRPPRTYLGATPPTAVKSSYRLCPTS
jgi:hypothetical protein